MHGETVKIIRNIFYVFVTNLISWPASYSYIMLTFLK